MPLPLPLQIAMKCARPAAQAGVQKPAPGFNRATAAALQPWIPAFAGTTNSSGNSLKITASSLVSLLITLLGSGAGPFALRARMGDPGPVATALIRALYRNTAAVEPQRHSAAPP
jgi:hypothetical protein